MQQDLDDPPPSYNDTQLAEYKYNPSAPLSESEFNRPIRSTTSTYNAAAYKDMNAHKNCHTSFSPFTEGTEHFSSNADSAGTARSINLLLPRSQGPNDKLVTTEKVNDGYLFWDNSLKADGPIFCSTSRSKWCLGAIKSHLSSEVNPQENVSIVHPTLNWCKSYMKTTWNMIAIKDCGTELATVKMVKEGDTVLNSDFLFLINSRGDELFRMKYINKTEGDGTTSYHYNVIAAEEQIGTFTLTNNGWVNTGYKFAYELPLDIPTLFHLMLCAVAADVYIRTYLRSLAKYFIVFFAVVIAIPTVMVSYFSFL